MKKVFFAIALISAGIIANAQVKFGAKAGLNLSNWSGNATEGTKTKTSFHLGGFANLALSESFSVQPELLFSGQGVNYKESGETWKYPFNYLTIPVMAQYNTTSGFYGETGPQFGFLLSAKEKYDGNSEDIKEDFNGFDLSWGVGLGYKLSSGFGVGARYNFGLSNILKDAGDDKAKNGLIQLGISYTFGGE